MKSRATQQQKLQYNTVFAVEALGGIKPVYTFKTPLGEKYAEINIQMRQELFKFKVKEMRQKLDENIAQRFGIYTDGKKENTLLKEIHEDNTDGEIKDEVQI